jgi:hypothetical protein
MTFQSHKVMDNFNSGVCYYVYNVFIWHLTFCDLHDMSTWCKGHGYQNKIYVWNLTKTCISTFPRGNFLAGILAKKTRVFIFYGFMCLRLCFHMALINSMVSWALRPLGLLLKLFCTQYIITCSNSFFIKKIIIIYFWKYSSDFIQYQWCTAGLSHRN